MVSLAELVKLLGALKPTFSEEHELVAELRRSIEKGHEIRSDQTGSDLVVVQTERIIAAKIRIINKATRSTCGQRKTRATTESQITRCNARR